MKMILALSFATLLASNAFAGDLTKGEESAQFRVKVATCKAMAKADKVKTNDAAFYGYMSACVAKVEVAVNVGK